jgi:ribosomal protein L40E
MVAVRNPLVAVFVTMFEAAIFAFLLCLPLLVFPILALPVEVSLFFAVAAFALAGTLAGRAGTFAAAALASSFLGGFIAYAIFFAIFFAPLSLGFAAAHGLVAGLGGWASAARRMTKVRSEVQLENVEKRRCRGCGARVGPRAKRCWSCRASLLRTT